MCERIGIIEICWSILEYIGIYWNIYGIGPLSRGGSDEPVREIQRCTNTTFIHVSSGRETTKNARRY